MEEFVKELTQILQEEAGPAVKIMRMEVLGVNDGLSQTLNLHIEGKIISKNFQLEEYYGEFLNGADITHIARNILNIFSGTMPFWSWNPLQERQIYIILAW